MTYEQAIARIPERDLPCFWVGSPEAVETQIGGIKRGEVTEMARSPGGRRLFLVTYGGDPDPLPRANYNSAVGGRNPKAYFDKAAREKPVVLFVGPVHGHETEGLTGLMNFMAVMETGCDLSGRARPELRSLGEHCRLLMIPSGNPDGLARFEPQALNGMEEDDVRFWGQGTWSDDTFCGWPGCKVQHPMVGDNVGFLGAYFNDAGVNPVHDEFFTPMSSEGPAILRVAQRWGPDVAVVLHSYEIPSAILRPAYVPEETQHVVLTLAERLYVRLRARGLPAGEVAWNVRLDGGGTPAPFNVTSALHHISGAASFTFECSHGIRGHEASFEEILETQLALYETMMEFVLER